MSSTVTDPVKSIRLLGTTWQSRGFRYWWLRGWLFMLWLGVFALSMWVVVILFRIFITEPDGPAFFRPTLLTLMSAAVIWSFVWGFSLLRRSEAEKKLGVPMIMRTGSTVEEQKRAGWRGYGYGLIAAPAVLVAQLFVVGVAAALVVSLVQKYISIEEFEAATGRKAPSRVRKRRRWKFAA